MSRQQLIGLGFSARSIQRRLENGRLHVILRGVYGVGFRPRTPMADAMAAVLACGPGSALSHRSAAALWGITREWPARPEVTCPTHRRTRGVHLHWSRSLTQHVTRRSAIPVTRPVRTLIDLAGVLDDARLARAVNEAQVMRLLSGEAVIAAARAACGRRGMSRLHALLEHGDAPTRSALEDAFLGFVAGFGLPRPEVNQRIGGYEVDMLWRAQGLIVELDGRAFHTQRRSFEWDRARDARLLAAGFRVLRTTWRRLHDDPAEEAAILRSLLDPALTRPATAMPAPATAMPAPATAMPATATTPSRR